MATVTAEQIGRYRKLDAALRLAVRSELRTVWKSVAHLGNDRIQDVLTTAVPDIIDKYGSMSASVAAEWFEELMDTAANVPDLYSPDAYRASARWAISPLYQEDRNPREAFSHLVVATERHVKSYGRSVLQSSVTRTPGAYFARVPSGPTTCEFCLVLASRGPIYTDRQSARYRAKDGGRYHDRCDCVPVPMRGKWIPDIKNPRGVRWEGDTVAGFNFDRMYTENYLPYHTSGDSMNDVVAKMRAANSATV